MILKVTEHKTRRGSHWKWLVGIICCCLTLSTRTATAQLQQFQLQLRQAQPTETANTDGNFNLKLVTLGGKQVWTDHLWVDGWRIQQNALTEHWRLLNPANVRYAWGTREACEHALQQQVMGQPRAGRRVVILLHGLMRSASSMHALKKYLTDQMDATVIAVEYASTRGSIGAHAAALRDIVAGLPAESQLQLVGHSMGNIVIRHAIGDWQRAGDHDTLERLDSVVMLGPPNHGASIARQLSRTALFGWIVGEAALELGPEWDAFESQLATPPCPFGIIAGRLPDNYIQNPLVEGAGDFVVSVEEAQLAGSTDLLEVPQLHSFLMDDPEVQQAVLNFLQHHAFAGEREIAP